MSVCGDETGITHYTPCVKPIDDGYIWAKYDINDIENATTLLANVNSLVGPMIVDGEEKTIATTYLFETTGEHWVKFKQNSTQLALHQWKDVTRLAEIYVPSGVNHTGANFLVNTPLCLRAYFFGHITGVGTNAFTVIALEHFNFECWYVSTGSNQFDGHRFRDDVVFNEGIVQLPALSTNKTFDGLKGVSLKIPSTVRSFRGNFCSGWRNLTEVTCLATTPPTCSTDIFSSCPLQNIYVPTESVEAYKTASRWSRHASKISAIPE